MLVQSGEAPCAREMFAWKNVCLKMLRRVAQWPRIFHGMHKALDLYFHRGGRGWGDELGVCPNT